MLATQYLLDITLPLEFMQYIQDTDQKMERLLYKYGEKTLFILKMIQDVHLVQNQS